MDERPRYHMSKGVYDPARHWSYRVTLAAFPANTMGLIVRAVLGVNSTIGPALGLEAEIGADGIVRASLRYPDGRVERRRELGSVMALRDEFRRLADHCRLTDADRLELFDHLKKWAGRDLRSDVDRLRGA